MRSLLIAGALLLAVSLPSVVAAADYYVSPEGRDDNPGTEERPWQTIGKAAGMAVAGDTVYIKQGIYRERLRPRNSGQPGKPVTFTAYPGHTVTLDGEQTSKGSYGGLVDISKKSYIEVSNLRVVNSGYYGIRVSESEQIVIKGNQTDFTFSSGIYVSGSRQVIIDGNDVQRACHGIGGVPPHYAPQEHITILGDTDGFEIKNNKISNPHNGRGKEGINIKAGAANGKVVNNQVHDMSRTGIYVDAYDRYVTNVELSGNVVTASSNGMVVASEKRGTISNIAIHNNVLYNNRNNGIWITHYLAGGPMQNISVVNNTIYHNGARGISVTNPEADNILVRNNIALQNGDEQLYIGLNVPSVIADHNLTSGDAGFLDAAAGNFKLVGNSPAIDTGTAAAAPSFDHARTYRPQGKGHDLGAFEFDGNAPGSSPSTPSYNHHLFLPSLQQ